MTKAEREACKAEFITGNYRTLTEYADAHGYSRRYIREIGAADKWLDDKAKHQRQIASKLLAQDKKDAINTLTARRPVFGYLFSSSAIFSFSTFIFSVPKIPSKGFSTL